MGGGYNGKDSKFPENFNFRNFYNSWVENSDNQKDHE